MHCGIAFGGGEVSHHLSPCSRSPAAVGVDGSSVRPADHVSAAGVVRLLSNHGSLAWVDFS